MGMQKPEQTGVKKWQRHNTFHNNHQGNKKRGYNTGFWCSKLKTESTQRANANKYKTNTGSEGNITPIRMYKKTVYMYKYKSAEQIHKLKKKCVIITHADHKGAYTVTIINTVLSTDAVSL